MLGVGVVEHEGVDGRHVPLRMKVAPVSAADVGARRIDPALSVLDAQVWAQHVGLGKFRTLLHAVLLDVVQEPFDVEFGKREKAAAALAAASAVARIEVLHGRMRDVPFVYGLREVHQKPSSCPSSASRSSRSTLPARSAPQCGQRSS